MLLFVFRKVTFVLGDISVFGLFILRKDQIQNDSNKRRGNDTGTAKDQLNSLRRMSKDTRISTHTVTNAERNG